MSQEEAALQRESSTLQSTVAAIKAEKQNMRVESERLKMQCGNVQSELQTLLDEKGRAPMETDTSAAPSTAPPAIVDTAGLPTAKSGTVPPPPSSTVSAHTLPVPQTPVRMTDVLGTPTRAKSPGSASGDREPPAARVSSMFENVLKFLEERDRAEREERKRCLKKWLRE